MSIFVFRFPMAYPTISFDPIDTTVDAIDANLSFKPFSSKAFSNFLMSGKKFHLQSNLRHTFHLLGRQFFISWKPLLDTFNSLHNIDMGYWCRILSISAFLAGTPSQ